MEALSQLHKSSIILRALSPAELLVDDRGYVVVASFAHAKLLEKSDRTYTLCGAPEFLAPEQIEGVEGHGTAADWWGLGAMLFALRCGTPPFGKGNELQIFKKVPPRVGGIALAWLVGAAWVAGSHKAHGWGGIHPADLPLISLRRAHPPRLPWWAGDRPPARPVGLQRRGRSRPRFWRVRQCALPPEGVGAPWRGAGWARRGESPYRAWVSLSRFSSVPTA